MQRAEILSTKANPSFSPQVKICGLTRIDEALACAELGVNAVGLIFYSKAPAAFRLSRQKESEMLCPRIRLLWASSSTKTLTLS
jgi:hypothetical protein